MLVISCYQNEIAIPLDKTVKNRSLSAWSLSKFDPHYQENISLNGKFNSYHLIVNPTTNELLLTDVHFKAADFVSDKNQFKVVVIDQNKNDSLDSEDEIFITSILADSVLTLGDSGVKNKNPLIVKNRDKFFEIFFKDYSLQKVFISPTENTNYDIEFVDHLNKDYRLVDQAMNFKDIETYLKPNTRLYILNVSTTCKGCINALSETNKLMNSAKNITALILFPENDNWEKINELTKNLKGNPDIAILKTQNPDFRKDFDFIAYPDGALFESDGSLLYNHIFPDRIAYIF
ncbi:hypothetical protein GCM10009122_21980 [Fulvivirga kasyanovii]|uniref:Redoxin domain-containing protein n=2 Tax=Fulvivirga kasyanovii TaxID=396812 RepID=A0ABW9RWB0_9BACT|nr:hypothetical protein [Fulvivirga kasyanovii]MTI28529.1 hypothetical protein [Fulvivirga kasyanovii]